MLSYENEPIQSNLNPFFIELFQCEGYPWLFSRMSNPPTIVLSNNGPKRKAYTHFPLV